MASTEEKGRKLNYHEACAVLGCGKSHFYNLVKAGALPVLRHGKQRGIQVYERDCEAYLHACDAQKNLCSE